MNFSVGQEREEGALPATAAIAQRWSRYRRNRPVNESLKQGAGALPRSLSGIHNGLLPASPCESLLTVKQRKQPFIRKEEQEEHR